MGRNFEFSVGEFYHLYNRGTEKRNVFIAKRDWERFLTLLCICNDSHSIVTRLHNKVPTTRDTIVDVVSYCLMPNHFHILVREKVENGTSLFMQKLMTAYTMYFNKRHSRGGVLFQGKYKGRHVSSDNYLMYLLSYIHLNPVKLIEPKWKEHGIRDRAHAKNYLKHYRYSSYLDYIGCAREESSILHQAALPEYFKSPRDFETNVLYWLNRAEN